MEIIENWIRTLQANPLHAILYSLIIIAVIVLIRTLRGRFVIAIKNKYTYIVVNMNGFSRTLKHSTFLWNPFEWILKGKAAPDWSFYSYEEEEDKSRKRSLLDDKTGKVDLRAQTLKCKFEASSSDPLKLTGVVDVLFRLDQSQIKGTLNIAAFGDVLKIRVLSALREELGRHADAEIRKQLKTIQSTALDKLREEGNKRTPGDGSVYIESGIGDLGVTFYELTCHIDEAGSREHKQLSSDEGQTDASTAMFFTVERISRIRREFLGGAGPAH